MFSSAAYWEARYLTGGTSGAGSRGKYALYKAQVVNALVREFGIQSVIDFGCGDGFQLGLATYRNYLGLDVSREAIRQCQRQFGKDKSKRFIHLSEYAGEQAEMALSLEVIFHLVEDEAYESYMHQLFAAATKLVAIFSSDYASWAADHHRNRCFTPWVAQHAPGWEVIRQYQNPFGSEMVSNFHVYALRQ